jgi:hypothetical protein
MFFECQNYLFQLQLDGIFIFYIYCQVNYAIMIITVEFFENRLEPLLAPIKKNRKTVMIPQIPAIDANSLKYHGRAGGLQIG